MVDSLLDVISEVTNGNETLTSIVLLALMSFLITAVYRTRIAVTKFLLNKTTVTLVVNNKLVTNYIERTTSNCKTYGNNIFSPTTNTKGAYDVTSGADGAKFIARYRGRLVYITRTEERGKNLAQSMLITYKLSILGKSTDWFSSLLSDAQNNIVYDDTYTSIMRFCDEDPEYTLHREPNAVFINQDVEETLFSRLDTFLDSKDLYEKLCVPHQFCILLHGEPGTGKSTIVNVIARYLKRNIFQCCRVEDLSSAIRRATNDIVVLEEVDVSSSTKRRTDFIDEDRPSKKSPEEGLTSLLLALDGKANDKTTIIVMTTNHISKLDPAFIRPGRVDLCLYIGFMHTTEFLRMVEWGTGYKHEEHIDIVEGVTGAKVQVDILSGLTGKEIVDKYKV